MITLALDKSPHSSASSEGAFLKGTSTPETVFP